MVISREKEDILPYELACKLFHLVEGKVYWKEPGQSRRLDRPAGHDHNGYWEIEVHLAGRKLKYQSRRIAYLLTHRQWPKGQLSGNQAKGQY